MLIRFELKLDMQRNEIDTPVVFEIQLVIFLVFGIIICFDFQIKIIDTTGIATAGIMLLIRCKKIPQLGGIGRIFI